jgi:tetratricopeptide (TPR) repeat protein
MASAGRRAAGAAIVLAAYYWVVFAHPMARSIESTGAQIAADIESSRALYAAGKYDQALAPTERLANALSSQAVYHSRLARVYHELNRPADEARSWERFMATSPTPIDACPMVARAYDRAGRPELAIAALERCATFQPVNPDFLVYLGQALIAAGRPADARRAFERGLEIEPKYADLHLLLGVRQFDQGELRPARRSFERFLALAPQRRTEVAVWLDRTARVK